MPNAYWKRELVIAAALFGGGFLLLPPAIYWVGKEVAGNYGVDRGMVTLADQIWADFLTLDPAAWLLVFTPYLLVQLLRLIRRTWKPRSV